MKTASTTWRRGISKVKSNTCFHVNYLDWGALVGFLRTCNVCMNCTNVNEYAREVDSRVASAVGLDENLNITFSVGKVIEAIVFTS